MKNKILEVSVALALSVASIGATCTDVSQGIATMIIVSYAWVGLVAYANRDMIIKK